MLSYLFLTALQSPPLLPLPRLLFHLFIRLFVVFFVLHFLPPTMLHFCSVTHPENLGWAVKVFRPVVGFCYNTAELLTGCMFQ